MEKKARKAPKKISAGYLENAALYYLQRYATSGANLRRVLMRKVQRSVKVHGGTAEDFAPLVDALVTRYAASGLIDDAAYARARTTSLRRQGRSKQAIQAKLQAKGLKKAEIETALSLTDEDEDAELKAALALAKKKKLGPFRAKPVKDPKDLQKEMAALARAGFSYDIAKQALQYKDEDEI